MPGIPITAAENDGQSEDHLRARLQHETFAAFGEGFTPAWNIDNTYDRLNSNLGPERDDNPPAPIEEWECRIGATKFFIPPLNINVSQVFKAGSMTGAAIRQQSAPKFNTGHTETYITMTLYFPTYEDIWGFEDEIFRIDFDGLADEGFDYDKFRDDFAGGSPITDNNRKGFRPASSDDAIDRFMSSLRGLIAQFKYAPFLPVRNAYLNRSFGITAVAMKDMTISTVPNFPFCMAVNLTMQKFNHKVFMPMVEDFSQGIHWGRFRQYMGRAAGRLAQSSRPIKEFSELDNKVDKSDVDVGRIIPSVRSSQEILEDTQFFEEGINSEDLYGTYRGVHQYRRHTAFEAGRFDFYFPFHSPARIDLPDLSNMRYDDVNWSQRPQNWWQRLMDSLGLSVNTYPEADYTVAKRIAEENGTQYMSGGRNEVRTLHDYMQLVNMTYDLMGPSELDSYIRRRLSEKGIEPGSGAATELTAQIQRAWFYVMYRFFMEDPSLSRALALQDQRRKNLTINEWEVPMWKIELDPDYVSVQGVSVTMGNVLAKLQLQMQDEPTLQHIGGADTRVDISLLISGEHAERELIRLRTMFESISGIARLEHGHGVLGFLGVQNVITELAGIRYAVPLAFEVDTVPNNPHVYNVRISLTDFDVFQQKREQLSSEQQAELVEAFGKRNPFLRLKQMWGMFNSYPDFPLAVRDQEGKIVGHLDPDFYFRSFKVLDDDLIDTNQSHFTGVGGDSQGEGVDALNRAVSKVDPSYNFMESDGVHVCVGEVDGEPQYIDLDEQGNVSFYSGGQASVIDARFNEPHAGNIIGEANVDGCTPASQWVEPYFGGGGDPWFQFSTMAKDMQYRDKSGRMIRAFPTYMLWLIDEGGNFAGMKLFDNFYGLQSVIDMSIVQSEDILGDTLVLRLSNLYSKLSTNFHDYMEETDPGARIINQWTRRQHRILTGATDYLVELDTMNLRPGIRVHLRMGYGANPNRMDTVFNGVVTEVETGEILTVVAQSDAIELSAIVDSKNEKGHTGKIDGNMFGLYLSQPRDLMITLLTQGSSRVKEAIALATQGEVFSENRYGIKHFGTMLYTPLDADEMDKHGRQKNKLSTVAMNQVEGDEEGEGGWNETGSVVGLTNMPMLKLMAAAWANLSAKRDYEIFKRNIYPGNGTGVAQFMGGDLGEIGLTKAVDGTERMVVGTGVNADGTSEFGIGNWEAYSSSDTRRALDAAIAAQVPSEEQSDTRSFNQYVAGATLTGLSMGALGFMNTRQGHSLVDIMGIAGPNEDDSPFDEVAFRAQTHMKTVWDLFKVCAALLPDYIVAVRPFEERSTVFYGKPHWLYTSGVIPLTTGTADGPSIDSPGELTEMLDKIEAQRYAADYTEDFETFFSGIDGWTPSSNSPGSPVSGPWTGNQEGPDLGATVAWEVGFRGDDLITAVAVAGAESNWDSNVKGDATSYGRAIGIWQVMHPLHSQLVPGISTEEDLRDPLNNARVAKALYDREKNRSPYRGAFSDWAVHPDSKNRTSASHPNGFYTPNNTYHRHIPAARAAVSRLGSGTTRENPGYQDSWMRLDDGAIARESMSATDEDLRPGTPASRAHTDEEFYNGHRQEGIPVSGDDTAGSIATQVYEHNRSQEQADEIWDEFRSIFPRDPDTKEAFHMARQLQNLTDDQRQAVEDEVFDQVVESFQKFMWRNPYARGWVVKVAHRALLSGSIFNPFRAIREAGRAIGNFFRSITGASNEDFQEESRNWNLSEVHSLFTIYISEGDNAAIEYMKNNHGDGKDSKGLISRLFENTGRGIKSLIDKVGDAWGAIWGIGSGLVNFMRFNLMQLSGGLTMASNMQKQTNTLSRVFNDSIYYSAGILDGEVVNPALYYADNPFTREYGEPVVEVRQPFQRMHTLGSFQHIIKNQIIESMNDVATVITATSNGEDPVTVHFDKSAPSEHQMERVVDTGLFYDHPKGWFGVKRIFKPVEAMRHATIARGGTTMETSAKRVALSHLKESLKDIYGGELIVLGDASIRPHDLVYMGDVYERMYGFFEVEQVVHHFTPETGFITSITPNACVSVNDPARWSMISLRRANSDITAVRDHMRRALKVQADNTGSGTSFGDNTIVPHAGETTLEQLAEWSEIQLTNSVQFTGGVTGLIKGFAGAAGGGGLVGSATAGATATTAIAAGSGAALLGGWVGWKAWKWVRDNLLDQHGCYIQYLTHNGQPMTGGIGGNHGTAVGHQYTKGIVVRGLRLGEIKTLGPDGSPRIRIQDVIKSVRWDETGPNDRAREVDLFVDRTLAEVRRIHQDGGPFMMNFATDIYWVKVLSVTDGDTMTVQTLGELRQGEYVPTGAVLGDGGKIRFAGIDAPEDNFKFDALRAELAFQAGDPGVRATRYAREHLVGKEVALRVMKANRQDEWERTIAYIFHNAPESIIDDAEQRKEFILNAAGGIPAVDWEAYLDDGQPYTFNWQMIAAGHANVYVGDMRRSKPGRGVTGSS